jgi:hypothetical protein
VKIPAVTVSSGRYQLLEQAGGAVLRWQPEGDPDWQERTIPAALWGLVKAAEAGQKVSPAQALRAAMGR